jgi:hypothetical protein
MSVNKQVRRNGNALIGGGLIVVGALFLLGQLFDINIGRFVWPFFVIVPGVVLLAAAFVANGGAGEGLVIAGSVVTTTGLLLLYQNASHHWASWAYGWALIPTSVGIGRMVYGSVKKRPETARTGRSLALIGVMLFLIGAVFFELIIGISGFGLGSYAWPVLLIGAGVLWLLRGLMAGKTEE